MKNKILLFLVSVISLSYCQEDSNKKFNNIVNNIIYRWPLGTVCGGYLSAMMSLETYNFYKRQWARYQNPQDTLMMPFADDNMTSTNKRLSQRTLNNNAINKRVKTNYLKKIGFSRRVIKIIGLPLICANIFPTAAGLYADWARGKKLENYLSINNQ